MKLPLYLLFTFWLLLSAPLAFAQQSHTEVTSSPGSTVVNNNGIIYVIPTIVLEQGKREEIILPAVNEAEKKRILRETLVPLLERQSQLITTELGKISNDFTLEVREKYLRLQRSNNELKEQIKEFSNDLNTTLDDLLLRVKISNEDILTILRQIYFMVAKLYHKATEKENRKATRDTIRQQKFHKYKTNQLVSQLEFEAGLELPFLALQKNNWSAKIRSDGGIRLGVTYHPIFRSRALLNPLASVAFTRAKLSKAHEAIYYSALNFRAGNDIPLKSFEDEYGFGRLSLPVGLAIFTPLKYEYVNSMAGLKNYALDANGTNTEIKRLNSVQVGWFAALKYARSWSKRRNIAFTLQYERNLNNFYYKRFADIMYNLPYKDLHSKMYHVTFSVSYYIL